MASTEQRGQPAPSPSWTPESLLALARRTEAAADGRLILPREALTGAEDGAAIRYLAMAAACAAGAASPPRGAVLHRLYDRLKGGSDLVRTLASARVSADAASLTFAREPGEFRRAPFQALNVGCGQTAIFDGRFEIAASAALVVRPLAGYAGRLGEADRRRLNQIPAAFRPSLPALFHGEDVSLPQPFGDGPALARPLVGARLAAACGLIAHERDIAALQAPSGMAHGRQSSYVEAQALA